MNKTVFKTFLTQMASPQLSHRIEHKAGLPCAPFYNLIVAQPFEIWKFWNQHLFCLMGTFWYLESNFSFEIFFFRNSFNKQNVPKNHQWKSFPNLSNPGLAHNSAEEWSICSILLLNCGSILGIRQVWKGFLLMVFGYIL